MMPEEIVGYRLLVVCCINGVVVPPLMAFYSARQWRVSLAHWFVGVTAFSFALLITISDLRHWQMIPSSIWSGIVFLTLMAIILSTWMTQNFFVGLAPLVRDARHAGRKRTKNNPQTADASLKDQE